MQELLEWVRAKSVALGELEAIKLLSRVFGEQFERAKESLSLPLGGHPLRAESP